MISQKLQEAINAQIVAEMWSANLYLSMSYFFAAKGYEGFASWMKAQAHEESDHADVLGEMARAIPNATATNAIADRKSVV